MKQDFFRNCTTLDALKAEYKRLAKLHHPDMPGGDLETMKQVNAQYDEAVKHIKANPGHADYKKAQKESPAQWREAVNAVMKVPGITIELCGSWIWVTGNTYAHKAVFKEAGFQWAHAKKAWYWHAPEDISNNRRKMTLDEIRAYHGSTLIAQTDEQQTKQDRLQAATA